ncbi:MAG TPA: hypothetical protein VK063_10775 [Beutenbergiaceae bacterium]|nr:hypothetical protein [Beutenbergiaceae bacterium]
MSTESDDNRREVSVPVRLGLYGALLLAAFAIAYILAGALVPDQTVQRWQEHSTTAPAPAIQSIHEVAL